MPVHGWEFLVLIGVLLLLFGAKKLPDMARSIGQSARVFKGEMKGMKADDQTTSTAKPEAAALPPTQPAAPSDAERDLASRPNAPERSS
ncbi:MAG: Sec-independent protein translocase subunit TatA [Pseudonocardia sp.]